MATAEDRFFAAASNTPPAPANAPKVYAVSHGDDLMQIYSRAWWSSFLITFALPTAGFGVVFAMGFLNIYWSSRCCILAAALLMLYGLYRFASPNEQEAQSGRGMLRGAIVGFLTCASLTVTFAEFAGTLRKATDQEIYEERLRNLEEGRQGRREP